eukprot:TRINITY_DN14257_c0_g1_i1.p1 TRINITY_DN14257_c0_g1~~TRINITY_DN14257_c0_g1_i1.p1  ORF type:complete len:278 (-),score=25.36 TRINITY_DN14257_c0_g1_i1:297-1130(-)
MSLLGFCADEIIQQGIVGWISSMIENAPLETLQLCVQSQNDCTLVVSSSSIKEIDIWARSGSQLKVDLRNLPKLESLTISSNGVWTPHLGGLVTMQPIEVYLRSPEFVQHGAVSRVHDRFGVLFMNDCASVYPMIAHIRLDSFLSPREVCACQQVAPVKDMSIQALVYLKNGDGCTNAESVSIVESSSSKASLLFKCGGVTTTAAVESLRLYANILASSNKFAAPIVFETWYDHLLRLESACSKEGLGFAEVSCIFHSLYFRRAGVSQRPSPAVEFL